MYQPSHPGTSKSHSDLIDNPNPSFSLFSPSLLHTLSTLLHLSSLLLPTHQSSKRVTVPPSSCAPMLPTPSVKREEGKGAGPVTKQQINTHNTRKRTTYMRVFQFETLIKTCVVCHIIFKLKFPHTCIKCIVEYLFPELEAGGYEGLQLPELCLSSGRVLPLSQHCLLPPCLQSCSLALWKLREVRTKDGRRK